MRSPRLFVALALMSVSACAGRHHTAGVGPVGQGTAFVQPRNAGASPDGATPHPPWAIGGGMQLPQGSYELALWFDIPRAQIVDWTVSCPGVEVSGSAGESFVQYRARRIEELRTARAKVASIASAPSDTISDAIPSDDIELPPGDLGAGRLASTVRVMTGGSGVCAVTATADDASVLGTYQVTRIHDPHLAERAKAAAHHATAIEVRSRAVTTPAPVPSTQESALVEYHVAKARAQAAARVELEAAQREHEQAAIAARIRAAQEAELAAQPRPPIIDHEQRRLDIALQAREDLRRRWQAWGAIPRPPMPVLLAETPGEPPFPGAVWVPGRWEWANGRWTWRAGYWSEPDVFDDAGGSMMVGVGVGYGFDFGDDREESRVRDHRKGPRIRDHRDEDSGSSIRDHRDGSSWSSKSETVRDHRSSSSSREDSVKSTIRDHRDDKKDDKDDKKDDGWGNARDHRRR